MDKTTRMNKEKREKKQKKKKTEDSGIGELIITDNFACDFTYLSSFNMDSLLKEATKLPGQYNKDNKNNKVLAPPKEDQDEESGNVNKLSEAAQRLVHICDSI